MRPFRRPIHALAVSHTLAIAVCVTVLTGIVPVGRAFFRQEINYNEGWNIYNAMTVAAHQPLYPAKYGYTDVNYPMLSFYIAAQLHRITHDYLFTGRAVSLLSLLGSCLIIAGIVRRLGASRLAGTLAGLFCFASFCSSAYYYVAADDPQMLAQFMSLAALSVYVYKRGSLRGLVATALLFVIAGFIKHNLIDIPLAVFIDMSIVSIPRALWFSLWGLLLVATGLLLNLHVGGPYFISQLLSSRSYSPMHALVQSVDFWGPLLLPLACTSYIAIQLLNDPARRILPFLLCLAVIANIYFSGGNGVSINAFFSSLLAMSLAVGLWFDNCLGPAVENSKRIRQWLSPGWAPTVVFVWLIIPFGLSANWPTSQRWRHMSEDQSEFDSDVAFLKSHPGPSICENLLQCVYAEKPYVYDPFNATRLIQLQLIDPTPLLNEISTRQFSVIELAGPNEDDAVTRSDRFTPQVMAAIKTHYRPVKQGTRATLYLPSFVEPQPKTR